MIPKPEKTKQSDANLKNFGVLINTLERGQVSTELQRKLEDIVAELNNDFAENKGAPKASMTLTLNFCLRDGILEVTRNISAKLPKQKSGHSIFSVSPNNQLLQEDPRQASLFEEDDKIARL